jgi:hypothetical protein
MPFPLSPAQQARANKWLCGIHAALAVASVVPAGLRIPLGTPRPIWCDANSTDPACIAACAPQTADAGLCTAVDYEQPLFIGTLAVPVLCAGFFGVTAAAHGYYWRSAARYGELVAAREMWWRWVEYAASVPLMLLVIASLNGLTLDLALLQTALLGSAGQFFGLAAEHEAAESKLGAARVVHLAGFAPVLGALLPVAVSLNRISEAPSFVPFLVVSQLMFFLSFGFVQSWQLLCGANSVERYRRADTAYLLLSLVCKTTLAGSVVAASYVLS